MGFWESLFGVRDSVDNMSEEDDEQIVERLRSQPIQSPSPPLSPSSSAFLFCPQLYLSIPPPLPPQLHFSPPPTTSRLMSAYLDFSPPPPPNFLSEKFLGVISFMRSTLVPLGTETVQEEIQAVMDRVALRLQVFTGIFPSPRLIAEITQSHSSKPLKRIIEEFGGTRKSAVLYYSLRPSVQRPRTLQIIIVEEEMAQFLSCSGEFISQTKDCSLAEERSVEITVEVDATNNGAHGVKAYENFPIVSHSEKKNTRDKLKRNYKSVSVITREDLEQNFGSSREDVANSFGVSVSTMKRIFRKHGISRWPFQPERKKERLMEVISPSMHEKHDLRLRSIQTPLHARSSPRTIALLDGGEMVRLDSSKQQSLVEFDVTTNSAHLVRASQSCSTISHSDETNSRETLKRKCTTKNVLSFEDLQQHFGCKLDDAAKALGVSVSTVKRISRKNGIPRWPSQKKRKVSKMDCILLEPQGEKDVSPTCSKMPNDGQTERGNEMVGHLQDQNEGPNLLNTENGSNKESITTLIFKDSVSVSEMDCILFEPEGEKNVSPTCKTPIVGIVLDFIGSPNLSNTENHSNEESITTPTFPDSVPGNYPAINLSISSMSND